MPSASTIVVPAAVPHDRTGQAACERVCRPDMARGPLDHLPAERAPELGGQLHLGRQHEAGVFVERSHDVPPGASGPPAPRSPRIAGRANRTRQGRWANVCPILGETGRRNA
jgi:hypothetical protein